MSGKAPRCSRHRAKRYGGKYKDRIERHKKGRVLREWRRAQKNPDNDLAKKPEPKGWRPASATRSN